MQNSVTRILDGVAATLRRVGSGLDDPYDAAQLAAAAELLDNLATRVEWRCDALVELTRRLSEVLAVAGAELPLALPSGASSAELLAARDAHLAALAGVRADDPEVDRALRAFLAWQLGEERALQRSAMFRES